MLQQNQRERTVQVFHPLYTDLQRQVLALLGVPPTAYTSALR